MLMTFDINSAIFALKSVDLNMTSNCDRTSTSEKGKKKKSVDRKSAAAQLCPDCKMASYAVTYITKRA